MAKPDSTDPTDTMHEYDTRRTKELHKANLQRLRNGNSLVVSLDAHPYVKRATEVSFTSDRRLLEVSFSHAIPEVFTSMDEITVVECWLDTLPGIWGRVLGDELARKYGLGSTCITALVEVETDG